MMIRNALVAVSLMLGVSGVSLAASHRGECLVNGKADHKISRAKCTGEGKVWQASVKKDAKMKREVAPEAAAPAEAPAEAPAAPAEGETK